MRSGRGVAWRGRAASWTPAGWELLKPIERTSGKQQLAIVTDSSILILASVVTY